MNLRNSEEKALKEAEFDYENPPIAEDNDQKLSNAIEYVQVRGWPQELAARKAGILRPKLQR